MASVSAASGDRRASSACPLTVADAHGGGKATAASVEVFAAAAREAASPALVRPNSAEYSFGGGGAGTGGTRRYSSKIPIRANPITNTMSRRKTPSTASPGEVVAAAAAGPVDVVVDSFEDDPVVAPA